MVGMQEAVRVYVCNMLLNVHSTFEQNLTDDCILFDSAIFKSLIAVLNRGQQGHNTSHTTRNVPRPNFALNSNSAFTDSASQGSRIPLVVEC